MASAATLRKNEPYGAKEALLLACVLSAAVALFSQPFSEARIISSGALFFSLSLLLSSLGKSLSQGAAYLRLELDSGKLLPFLLQGLAGFAILCAISFLGSVLLYAFGILDTFEVREKIQSLSILSIIFAVSLSPIGEEMFFRGYLFRKMSESLPIRKSAEARHFLGAAASSAVFSIMHISYGSFAQLAFAFAFGLALCWLSAKSGSIIPPIISHASFNLLSISISVLA
ncbi:MAG: CPBP family intramembrane metalloprotease [Candidatus Micrarchaeota archaeon]|nr:CPBP family intramembrane metalloprotease [Candidatus Micrarchaeota archaeon]